METPPAELHVQIGGQAREVEAKLKAMSDIERQSFALDVVDAHWWAEGRARPSRQN
jgi:hypothetical protein